MLSFTHVEDYIEVLAGYEPGGTSVLFNTNKYAFSLARYDVKIVESMANATVWGNMALTDKQGELALKLVEKYRRQYTSHGIDITSIIENPQWRMPLRKVDRTQRIWLEDGRIKVKFPYNQNWIDDLRKFKESSQGQVVWKTDEKVWELALTEYNVNWIVAWAQTWKIEIDSALNDLYNKILDVEEDPYEIKLIQHNQEFTITNAAESLVNYINEHLGGFGLDNVTKLVDYSGVLGYTVDRGIKYNELLDLFGPDRLIHVPSTEDGSLDLIFDYAELTGRWPVCIHNPGTTQTFDLSRFSENEIVKFDPAGRTKTPDYNYYTAKVVYANKIPAHWEWPIPLLVSTVEMMFSGAKLNWMNRAEKIIHYSYAPLREKNGDS